MVSVFDFGFDKSWEGLTGWEQGGVVFGPLAFQQCGLGSLDVMVGLSLLVLYSAQRGFSLGILVFPSSQKPGYDCMS